MENKSSVKSFGILFAIVFLIIATWPLLNSEEIRIWSLVVSVIFLILGLIKSRILNPLNNFWIKLGEFLGKIVAPIVMLFIFFVIITPMSFLVKIMRKDLLNVKFDKNKSSYWIKRDEDLGPMKNQF
tara:strand:+ start:341 stop:721 length:381 start_codon:yes stop_codon:yes gene_type:complete